MRQRVRRRGQPLWAEEAGALRELCMCAAQTPGRREKRKKGGGTGALAQCGTLRVDARAHARKLRAAAHNHEISCTNLPLFFLLCTPQRQPLPPPP